MMKGCFQTRLSFMGQVHCGSNKYVRRLHAHCSSGLPITLVLPFRFVLEDVYLACFAVLHLGRSNHHSVHSMQIEITHRVAWRASVHRFHCNQTTISSQALLPGEGDLVCQSGCSGTVGNMSFYCTVFSTSEDWTTGGRTYTYNATGVTSFEAS